MRQVFTAADVSPVAYPADAPEPRGDRRYWRVDLGREKPGWAWVPASGPRPSEDWVVDELNRLRELVGWVLDSELLSRGGLQLGQ